MFVLSHMILFRYVPHDCLNYQQVFLRRRAVSFSHEFSKKCFLITPTFVGRKISIYAFINES